MFKEKTTRKLISCLSVILMTLSLIFPYIGNSYANENIATSKWVKEKVKMVVDSYSDTKDPWVIADLGALGIKVSDESIQSITNMLFEEVKQEQPEKIKEEEKQTEEIKEEEKQTEEAKEEKQTEEAKEEKQTEEIKEEKQPEEVKEEKQTEEVKEEKQLEEVKEEKQTEEVKEVHAKETTKFVLTKDSGKLSKGILALRSQGVDVENFLGYNLVEQLCKVYDRKYNSYAFSSILYALNSADYKYKDVQKEKEYILNQILSNVNKDGVWSDDWGYEDMTGFCIFALAPYIHQNNVKDAIENAIDYISLKQQNTGDIKEYPGNSNSFSVIAGSILSANYKYLYDERLVKNLNTFIDALRKYDVENTADFKWQIDKDKSDYSKEQAFRVLVSYLKNRQTNRSIYDFRNIPLREFTEKQLIGNTEITPNKTDVIYYEPSEVQGKEFDFESLESMDLSDIDLKKEIQDSRVKWINEKEKNISDYYKKQQDISNPWVIADLGALGESVSKKSIQNITKSLFDKEEITKEEGKLLKAILALRSQGVDVENFLGYNLVEELVNKLSENIYKEETKDNLFYIIYTLGPSLEALNSDDYKVENIDKVRKRIVQLIIGLQNEEGVWKSSFGKDIFIADNTGFMVYALSSYNRFSDEDLERKIEKSSLYFAKRQDEMDNSLSGGSSNSISMLLGGFSSFDYKIANDMNIYFNLFTDKDNFESVDINIIDALRKYDLEGYKVRISNLLKESNDTSQEQALRALIAYEKNMKSGKSIYDFRDVPLKNFSKKDLTGKGSSTSSGGSGSSSNSISVYLRLDGIQQGTDKVETWIEKEKIDVPKDSTVKTLIQKAAKQHNIQYEDSGNYISKMKLSGGQWLGQFTNGKYSGWMYKVNGKQPEKGYADFKINDGDYVLWYYTNDYTKEDSAIKYSGSSSGGGSSNKNTNDNKDIKVEVKSEIKQGIQKIVFDDNLEKKIQQNIEKLAKENKKIITIDVKKDDEKHQNIEKSELIIKKNIIEKIQKEKDISLNIDMDDVDILFDNKAVNILNENLNKDKKESDLTIEVSQVKNKVKNPSLETLVGQRPVYDINVFIDSKKIKAYNDANIKISIAYKLKAGENKDQITVYYIKDDGNYEEVTDAKYDPFNQKVVFTTKHLSYYAVGIKENKKEEQNKIVKLDENDKNTWYYDVISEMVKNKILYNMNREEIIPKQSITRAEFVTMLYNASKNKNVYNSEFKDVAKDYWAYNAISWAYENSIIRGRNSMFYPDENITRQEMAVILSDYISNLKIETQYKEKNIKFVDENQISDWAKKSVKYLSDKNIMIGDMNSKFNPKENATFAQACMTIYNIIK